MAGADPNKLFYITGDRRPSDGTVDIEGEGKEPLTYKQAVEAAQGYIDEHGQDCVYIIECRVVLVMTRGGATFTPPLGADGRTPHPSAKRSPRRKQRSQRHR